MREKNLRFNDAVKRRTEKFKKSAAYSAQTVGNAIVDAHEKATDITGDLGDSFHGIRQGVRRAAADVSNEFGNH